MSRLSQVAKFAWKTLKRAPMCGRIRNLARWEPLADEAPGYTVVIAAMHRLWPVAAANLRLIAKLERTSLAEVVVVFDEREEVVLPLLREALDELQGQGLRVRVLGYSERQRRVTRSIDWGWVYAWLSWSLGIGASRTRWVILHDLDAMPIHPRIFESLFEAARRSDAQFQGISRYGGNGVTEEMNLVTTYEMTLDAAWLRAHARPFDGFNKTRFERGRYVDFDTLLHVQRRAPRRRVEPVDPSWLVHPSQLICDFTDHVAGRRRRARPNSSLMVLPYLMHLGDPGFDLGGPARTLAQDGAESVELWGRPCHIGDVHAVHWAWMEKQVRQVEEHLFRRTRPEVEEFLAGFSRRARGSRSDSDDSQRLARAAAE